MDTAVKMCQVCEETKAKRWTCRDCGALCCTHQCLGKAMHSAIATCQVCAMMKSLDKRKPLG
jgi:hypothetical protein